ncbi:hypothetical protein [Bdellovibrio sp. HCB337]|uniref:hypothetical protein n=1 Tax=Bdellovibrio sp. HCB337 TaxID=3394358 RepID=UPI0039A70234
MKKINFKILSLGMITLTIVGISISTLGRGSGNRWESRMVKPDDSSQDRKSTLNLNTGKKYNQDGTAAPAETPAPADVIAYGEGTLHCRDAVLKLNTQFDNPNSPGVSEIKIVELNHNATRVFNCTDISPTLTNSTGNAVNGGTITVKCGNGQLHVAASSCTAPTPTPAPSPTATATATPSATPTPPAGYSVAACGSWCSDTVYTCRRQAGKNQTTTIPYRRCQSGQVLLTNSGACGAQPTGCY